MQLGRALLSLLACLLCSGAARAEGQRARSASLSKHHAKFSSSILNHRLFARLTEEVRSSARRFLHARGKKTFDIPVEIDVILVGFDGIGAYEYRVDPHRLQELLVSTYGTRRPHAKDLDEELLVQYAITYNVVEAPETAILQLEEVIAKSLVPSGSKAKHKQGPTWLNDGFGKGMDAFDVEALDVEPAIDKMVAEIFGTETKSDDWQRQSAIVVLNPNKRRMKVKMPNGTAAPFSSPFSTHDWDRGLWDVEALAHEEAGYLYRYRYNGAGRSAAWLSGSSYIVVDVSAGPCTFGPRMGASGVVTPLSIPRVSDVMYQSVGSLMLHGENMTDGGTMTAVAVARDAVFRGKIAATIVSAIRHAILPDVWVNNIGDFERVMVPIMVVRNHLDFNPLAPGHRCSINASRIQEQVFGMLGSREDAVVTISLHSLHEHRQLAVALRKAMYSKSEGVVLEGAEAGIHRQSLSYVDSDALLEEFGHASDTLTSGWVGQALEKQPLWQSAMGHTKTRIVPVYVLSIKDAPFNLLMDNRGVMAANENAVIVLQTAAVVGERQYGRAAVDHMLEGDPVYVSTLEVERHITSGIATTLMGAGPPYESHVRHRRGAVNDWLWSMGHTPYGPYSNAPTLSAMTLASMRRGAVAIRIDALLRALRSALARVDAFSEEFCKPAFGDVRGAGAKVPMPANATWLDILYSNPSGGDPPLSPGVIEDLESSLARFEKGLVAAVKLIYDGKLLDAERQLKQLVGLERGFAEAVDAGLADARARLGCCHVEHTLRRPPSHLAIYLVFVGAAMLAWLVVGSCCVVREGEQGPLLMQPQLPGFRF